MLCGDLDGWDVGRWEVQEGVDICIHIADSLCCTAETKHNFVKQLYPNVLIKRLFPSFSARKWSLQRMSE